MTAEHIKENNEAIGKSMRKDFECMNISDEVKSTMDRDSILNAARNIVCNGRDKEYGEPEDSFDTIACLWSAYLAAAIGRPFVLHSTDVAAMMALLKIARIATDSGKADSWIDLAGYAACGGECAQIAVDG